VDAPGAARWRAGSREQQAIIRLDVIGVSHG
jgi:hypothetical protein